METITISISDLLKLCKDVYTDGFFSAETYNDTILNSVEEAYNYEYEKQILEQAYTYVKELS